LKNSKTYLIGPTESVLTKRGNRFPNFADYLVEENQDIIYYTSNFYHAEKRFFNGNEIKEAKEETIYELNVLNVLAYYNNVSPRRVFSNFFFSLKLFFILLFKVRKSDKILLPSRPVELIYFMSLLKRIKGVSIYLDIQDIWPDALEIKNKKKKKVFELYCNTYLKPALKHYTHTLHVAPSFNNWLKRYSKNTPSVFVPLGWENARWKNIKKTQHNSKDKTIYLVCVAQLQHQIDVMPILQAINNQKQFHFTIIGEDGKGERYNEVMDYINKNEMSNVKIIGKVQRDEMKLHLKDKTIGILPMITSAIPNKIFDYLAAKLPILVLGENDSADFVKNNKIGWSCPYNSEALQKILLSLTKDDIQNKLEQVNQIRANYSRNHLHKKLGEIIIECNNLHKN